MTSMIIGNMPSGPPDAGTRPQKAEPPTKSEVENSPFRKNLQQAMKNDGTDKRPDGEKSVDERTRPEKTESSETGNRKVKDESEDSKVRDKAGDPKAKVQAKGGDSGVKNLLRKGAVKTLGIKDKSSGKDVGKAETTDLSKKLSVGKVKTDKNNKSDSVDEKVSAVKEPETKKKNPVVQPVGTDSGKKGIDPAVQSGKDDKKETDKSEKKKKTDGSEIIPFPVAADKVSIRNENIALQGGAHTVKTNGRTPGPDQKKGKDQAVLTVVDTRAKHTGQPKADSAVIKTDKTADGTDKPGKDSNTIVLGSQNGDHHSADGPRSFASRLNASHEAVLTRELQQNGNDQIVKKASFVLKDNHQGEIKLILKPESLGQVKIHLNMNENHLVGKIIVENNRVGQIFQNNLANLSRAFEEAGMSSSSLEVTVGDGNRQGGKQQNQKDQPFYSDRLRVLDRAVPAAQTYTAGRLDRHINLVV